MRRRSKLIGLFLFLSVAVSAIALSQPTAVAQSGDGAQVGRKAPSFSVRTLGNATVSLDDYRGKVLILEFFTSWCHVCKDTMPEFRQVRENFSPENLAILSVESTPAVSLENVRVFKSEYGGDWPFAKVPEVADRYGVEGYPTVFVIDPDGYIAFKSAGSVPPGVLEDVVSDLLKGQEAPENGGENQAEISDVIVDVKVEPENAGGIVASGLKIKRNGVLLSTYRVKANPGYEFAGWSGEEIPENQENSRTLKITPGPDTEITANFALTENHAVTENCAVTENHAGLKERYENLTAGYKSLNENYLDLSSTYDELLENYGSVLDNLDSTIKERDNLESRVQSLQKSLAEKKAKIENIETKLVSIRDQLKEKKSEISQQSSEIESLENEAFLWQIGTAVAVLVAVLGVFFYIFKPTDSTDCRSSEPALKGTNPDVTTRASLLDFGGIRRGFLKKSSI